MKKKFNSLGCFCYHRRQITRLRVCVRVSNYVERSQSCEALKWNFFMACPSGGFSHSPFETQMERQTYFFCFLFKSLFDFIARCWSLSTWLILSDTSIFARYRALCSCFGFAKATAFQLRISIERTPINDHRKKKAIFANIIASHGSNSIYLINFLDHFFVLHSTLVV